MTTTRAAEVRTQASVRATPTKRVSAIEIGAPARRITHADPTPDSVPIVTVPTANAIHCGGQALPPPAVTLA